MTAPPSSERDRQKRAAATRVVAEIEDGMALGLGSGSTADFAIEALGACIAEGLRIVRIPTSEKTRPWRGGSACRSRASPSIVASISRSTTPNPIERGTLNLIKGFGGALLREKIVASASDRIIVVVDENGQHPALQSHCSAMTSFAVRSGGGDRDERGVSIR